MAMNTIVRSGHTYSHTVLVLSFIHISFEKCFNGLFIKEIMDTRLVEGYIFLAEILYLLQRGGRTDIPLRTRKGFPPGRYSLLQGAYP